VSFALAFIGVSIIGTWGMASIGMIAGGIILLVAPGDANTASDPTLGAIVLLVAGFISLGAMGAVVGPLLGLDPPLPIKAKSIIPHARMTKWAKAGNIRDLPNGKAKELRLRSQRVALVRVDDRVYALNALCSHARLPFGGFPLSPITPEPVRDDCVTCPFHGARYELQSGRVVRQPFSSQWNNDHPLLGRLQSKLFFFNKRSEDLQTYPVKIERGEISVGLPK
jgi:nitrite reductase/ring-hydroxylating ferredoxin subunit